MAKRLELVKDPDFREILKKNCRPIVGNQRNAQEEALIPNKTNKVRHAQIIQNIWNIVIKYK
jgi:hypothetical protein